MAPGPKSGTTMERIGRRRGDNRPLFMPGERRCDPDRCGQFSLHAKVRIETDDREGLERLCRYFARREGGKARPVMRLGICGEHGGDPRSIAFCAGLGLDYVSCSPFRVPLARLAAQAALRSSIDSKGKRGR